MYVQLGNQADVNQHAVAVAAGTTNVNGNVIDMMGFECLMVVVGWGTLTAGGTRKLKLQAGTLSNGSDMADVANSGVPAGAGVYVPDGASGQFIVGDYLRIAVPPLRYLRPVAVRGAQNDAINFMISVRYNVSRPPVAAAVRDANLSGSVVTVVEQGLGTAN